MYFCYIHVVQLLEDPEEKVTHFSKYLQVLQIKYFMNWNKSLEKNEPWEASILCVIICKVNSNENKLCPTGLNRIICWPGKLVLPCYRSVGYIISTTKTVLYCNGAETISLMDAWKNAAWVSKQLQECSCFLTCIEATDWQPYYRRQYNA